MGYTQRTDTPLKPHPLVDAPPLAVYTLDTGDLVAVSIATSAGNGTTLVVNGAAWLVDADGDPQGVDTDGAPGADMPILTTTAHTADVAQVAALGVQGIADALRDLLLGEPAPDPAPIAWGAQLREQLSIRNVITIALGTPIDWSGA